MGWFQIGTRPRQADRARWDGRFRRFRALPASPGSPAGGTRGGALGNLELDGGGGGSADQTRCSDDERSRNPDITMR